MQLSLTVLVPRVWPFLRHTISSVRRAALETLFTLLSKADQVNLDIKLLEQIWQNGCNYSVCSSEYWLILFIVLQSCALWINPILQDMLRHIFQSCILESNEEILELIRKVCCLTKTVYLGMLRLILHQYRILSLALFCQLIMERHQCLGPVWFDVNIDF